MNNTTVPSAPGAVPDPDRVASILDSFAFGEVSGFYDIETADGRRVIARRKLSPSGDELRSTFEVLTIEAIRTAWDHIVPDDRPDNGFDDEDGRVYSAVTAGGAGSAWRSAGDPGVEWVTVEIDLDDGDSAPDEDVDDEIARKITAALAS